MAIQVKTSRPSRGRNSGPVKLAYWWAHARRKLKEVHDRDGFPITAEGLKRIAKSRLSEKLSYIAKYMGWTKVVP